jgi:hypothetical protein
VTVEEDVSLLRAQVGRLQAVVNQLAGTTPVKLGDSVAAGSHSNPNAAAPAATSAGAPAVRVERNWRTMSAAHADVAWNHLAEFVDWLVARYELDDTLPECWYRHGPLVEELNALQFFWTAAFANPHAKAIEPAQFHTLLGQVLVRLRGWNRYGCAAGTHHDSQPVGPDDAALAEREKYIQADIQHRACHDGAPQPGSP